MAPEATILMPTFDHGPLLRRSVASVLRQTVADFELFVVGDGVPDVTREILADLGRDPRVRFFDNRVKGENHGELYRHAALQEAKGRIVCYLADDDLYLPDHLETMRELLRDADFAHTLPFRVETSGEVFVHALDLSLSTHRWLIAGRPELNRLPLSMVGHTLELYRRLPRGWHVAPRGKSITLHAWREMLNAHPCRARSGFHPTVINFPSTLRRSMTLDERAVELDRWFARIDDPEWRRQLVRTILEERARKAAHLGAGADLRRGCVLSVVPFSIVDAISRLRRRLTGRGAARR